MGIGTASEPSATPCATAYTRRNIQAAWAVHIFTASGVCVGYLGLNAVNDGRARGAILWLIAALILDGIDGPIARKLAVKERIPNINGNSLDLIIDYFTCTIIPVAFLDRFELLPEHTSGPASFVILAGGALWMARTDQETSDGWFRGFPAEWNMIIPSLFLLGFDKWVNLAICGVFCVLQLTKLEFAHPVSVREKRPISIFFMTLWLGSMMWLAIAERDILVIQIVLMVAPLWTFWQVFDRYRTTHRGRTTLAA